jgi:ArsR family transcriptional regulator, arsenate/arsenite/antimonite-responsive transcriptional repressor
MNKTTVIAALGALAQDTRLDIFRLLVERGPEGMAAGEIGERLKQPSPTLSFHLNQLRHARLITSRRESRSIIYRANFTTMIGLMGYLTEKCCGGRAQLLRGAALAPTAGSDGLCGPGACAPIQIQTRPGPKAATSARKRDSLALRT